MIPLFEQPSPTNAPHPRRKWNTTAPSLEEAQKLRETGTKALIEPNIVSPN